MADINCIKCKRITPNIDTRVEDITVNKYDPEDKLLAKKNRRVIGTWTRPTIKATCGVCGSKKNSLCKIHIKEDIPEDVPEGTL